MNTAVAKHHALSRESVCEGELAPKLQDLVCQLQHAVCVAGSLGAMQGVCINYDKEQLEEYAKAYLEYTQREPSGQSTQCEEEEVEVEVD